MPENKAVDFVRVQVGPLTRDLFFRPGSSDSGVIGQIFYDHAYDLRRLRRHSELAEFLQKARASGKKPLIIDAGANIGASTIYFAGQCPDALVIALEPESENFQLLVKNTKGLNVVPLQCALAGSPMKARIIDPGEGFWGFRVEPVNEQFSGKAVDCVTVNDLYKRYQSEFFAFIVKMDIEGAEKEVFSANGEWVTSTPLVIIEVHDWLLPKQGTALPFLQCIANQNRDFVHISENIFSISNNLDAQLPPPKRARTKILNSRVKRDIKASTKQINDDDSRQAGKIITPERCLEGEVLILRPPDQEELRSERQVEVMKFRAAEVAFHAEEAHLRAELTDSQHHIEADNKEFRAAEVAFHAEEARLRGMLAERDGQIQTILQSYS
jgi:FkbM family methyltransferase